MKKLLVILSLMLFAFTFSGFMGIGDDNPSVEDQRKARIKENDQTLQMLHKGFPDSKEKIKKAYGYATFSNIGINLFVVSTERGIGMAHNNKNGKNTYMNMFSGGGGLGMGVKDFNVVFIFDNQKVYDDFLNSGWEANAQADAAVKSGEKGDDLAVAITIAPGVHLYKMTEAGVALQATVQGTKYWKDEDLN